MPDLGDDRYGRLAGMVALLRADRRYRLQEVRSSGPAQGRETRHLVRAFGPSTLADVEGRLPAPADLNFRRWNDATVSIGDPDDDPAVRPLLDVRVSFYPRAPWWDTPPSGWTVARPRWDDPIVTPGRGIRLLTSAAALAWRRGESMPITIDYAMDESGVHHIVTVRGAGPETTRTAADAFTALALVRRRCERYGFLLGVQGARGDVVASRMQLQAGGRFAYEVSLGRPAEVERSVFDPASPEQVTTLAKQRRFRKRWLKSLTGRTTDG